MDRRRFLQEAAPVHHFCLSPTAQAGIKNSPSRLLKNPTFDAGHE